MMKGQQVVIGSLLLCLVAGQDNTVPRKVLVERTLPCPVEDDIVPCTCHATNNDMDLDCSRVEDEAQLQRVFETVFPFPNFRKFIMTDNAYVKVWATGIFGVVTFREFEVVRSILEKVEEHVFDNSASTVVSMSFQSGNLTTFPFAELASFSSLERLDLRRNRIASFPVLSSSSLLYLNLGGNVISEIVDGAFINLVEVEQINLYENHITEIIAGTFSGHHNLYYINMNNNQLQVIPTGAIQLTSKRSGFVFLGNNSITDIGPNGITDVGNGSIHLENNNLQSLDEVVFRPILEEDASIVVEGNPLACGCDIAWLIKSEYLHLVDEKATCYDGELLIELNPGIYDVCDLDIGEE